MRFPSSSGSSSVLTVHKMDFSETPALSGKFIRWVLERTREDTPPSSSQGMPNLRSGTPFLHSSRKVAPLTSKFKETLNFSSSAMESGQRFQYANFNLHPPPVNHGPSLSSSCFIFHVLFSMKIFLTRLLNMTPLLLKMAPLLLNMAPLLIYLAPWPLVLQIRTLLPPPRTTLSGSLCSFS